MLVRIKLVAGGGLVPLTAGEDQAPENTWLQFNVTIYGGRMLLTLISTKYVDFISPSFSISVVLTLSLMNDDMLQLE